MKRFAFGCALAATLLMPVHAVAKTKDMALQGFALPQDKDVTIVLMRPDVSIGELQAGGLPQPNAEWTEAARANIRQALQLELAGRDIELVDMEEKAAAYRAMKQEAAVAACTEDKTSELEARLAAEREAALAAATAGFGIDAGEGEDASDAVESDAEAAAEAAADAVEAAAAAQEEMFAKLDAEADAREAEAREALGPVIEVCASRATADLVDAQKLVAEYNALHGAVIDAIAVHKYGMGPRDVTVGSVLLGGLFSGKSGKLPTQKGKFDYTLGSGTSALAEVSGANYGLFIMTNDQFASGGRKAMQVLGGLGCIIGACVLVSGGTHVAYVSLVELETGRIVWFNLQRGSEGDVREEDGALKMVSTILANMPVKPGQRSGSTGT